MVRIEYEEMYNKFQVILISKGFTEQRAKLASRLFAEASLDGFQSHGVNRFTRFINSIDKGNININVEPEKIEEVGNIERWDGNLGPGNINAYRIMEKAIEKAKKEGVGVIALRNTNHWMRGGTYGWQAAKNDCSAICFTNTLPNMPPWGAKECRIGNNPLVMAIPREEKHIVYDGAVSQYSFGKLNEYKAKDELLPFPGGFNLTGELTRDPNEILASNEPLPIGCWKGSGIAMMMDLYASLLSSGLNTFRIGKGREEKNVSQLFITFDMSEKMNKELIEETIDYIHEAQIAHNGEIEYPVYERMRLYARRVMRQLEKMGYDCIMYPFNLSQKKMAQLAGLGSMGKNSLIINPDYGPWIRLQSILTNAPLVPDKEYTRDLCGECTRCIDTCPTGALTPYKVDPEKCLIGIKEQDLARLIEEDLLYTAFRDTPDHVFKEYMPRLTENSVLMCTACQEACPYGREKRSQSRH